MKTIAIGCDHAGYIYKEKIKIYLESQGYKVNDFGTNSTDSVDYPDFIHPVAKDVESREEGMGIIICGSGNGVAMTANKYSNIRAAICWNEEIAELARLHNNANIIAIPARFIADSTAIDLVRVFLKTSFEGGRHQRRVAKISSC